MAVMDFYELISTVGILAVTLILCTAGYFIIFLAYLHAKYDHLPGPKRTRLVYLNIKSYPISTL